MNELNNIVGICNKKSSIKKYKHAINPDLMIFGGTLVKKIDQFENKTYIKICSVSPKDNSYNFTEDIFICSSENITIIPIKLWNIFLPIILKNRLKILQNKSLVDILLNLKVGQKVLVSGKSDDNLPVNLECIIKLILENSQIGIGTWYEFQIQNSNNTFYGKADEILDLIVPQQKTSFNELIDFSNNISQSKLPVIDKFTNQYQNLSSKDEDQTQSQHGLTIISDVDARKEKAQTIKELQMQLKLLNSNENKLSPEPDQIKIIEDQNKKIHSTTIISSTSLNDEHSTKELIHSEIFTTEEPYQNIKNSTENSTENKNKIITNNNNEHRLKLFNIANQLSEITKSNDNFPNTILDFNLLTTIEHELNVLKKYFTDNQKSIDNIYDDGDADDTQPIVENHQPFIQKNTNDTYQKTCYNNETFFKDIRQREQQVFVKSSPKISITENSNRNIQNSSKFNDVHREYQNCNDDDDDDDGDYDDDNNVSNDNDDENLNQHSVEKNIDFEVNVFVCSNCNKKYMNLIKVKVNQCNHEFCKDCFIKAVTQTQTTLKCPHVKSNGNLCNTIIQEYFIEQIVPSHVYKIYSMKLNQEIIKNLPNGFLCKTPKCLGVWICDNQNIKSYECPVCKVFNCVACEVIHTGSTCKQYERQIIYGNDQNAANLMKQKLSEDQVMAHDLIMKGNVQTDSQAETAVALRKSLPNMKTDEIYWAVEQSHIFEKAQNLLQHECELCMELYPRNQMFYMVHCSHICCMECARIYFTERITEHSIVQCVCPFCNTPVMTADIKDEENVYFSLLETVLRTLLDKHIFDIFLNKVRDRCLLRDPFFKWCTRCAFGYSIQRDQMAVTCPECDIITCAECRKPWEEQHHGITCEEFADWKRDNNPDTQEQEIIKYLETNGIQCPKCKLKYSLSKGGCMHFTCLECKHEFCSGCNQPITRKSNCINIDSCLKRGLHCHHPRNCLYFLRDKTIEELLQLLNRHDIDYTKEDQNPTRECKIPIQRETPAGLVDDQCNAIVNDDQGGLCGIHYIEYLVDLINKSNIDPITIMSEVECSAELTRNAIENIPDAKNPPNIDTYKRQILKINNSALNSSATFTNGNGTSGTTYNI